MFKTHQNKMLLLVSTLALLSACIFESKEKTIEVLDSSSEASIDLSSSVLSDSISPVSSSESALLISSNNVQLSVGGQTIDGGMSSSVAVSNTEESTGSSRDDSGSISSSSQSANEQSSSSMQMHHDETSKYITHSLTYYPMYRQRVDYVYDEDNRVIQKAWRNSSENKDFHRKTYRYTPTGDTLLIISFSYDEYSNHSLFNTIDDEHYEWYSSYNAAADTLNLIMPISSENSRVWLRTEQYDDQGTQILVSDKSTTPEMENATRKVAYYSSDMKLDSLYSYYKNY